MFKYDALLYYFVCNWSAPPQKKTPNKNQQKQKQKLLVSSKAVPETIRQRNFFRQCRSKKCTCLRLFPVVEIHQTHTWFLGIYTLRELADIKKNIDVTRFTFYY